MAFQYNSLRKITCAKLLHNLQLHQTVILFHYSTYCVVGTWTTCPKDISPRTISPRNVLTLQCSCCLFSTRVFYERFNTICSCCLLLTNMFNFEVKGKERLVGSVEMHSEIFAHRCSMLLEQNDHT